jgi:predicted CXXCH cytochrome family protein
MACVLGTAHIGDSRDIPRLSLDNCLGCHDGSVAKEVGTHRHPVNALYLGSRKGLNRITDKKIVLVEGRITCLSFHNPYGTRKGKLVKSNEGSRLCLACHRK